MTPRSSICLASAFFLLFAAGASPIAAGAPEPSAEIGQASTAAAISARIEIFDRDLQRLRRFMGASEAGELDIGIRSTLPRDLYSQALTLWQQTDRLSFEVMRVHATPPPPPAGDIGLPDVLRRLEDANRILLRVMEELKIPSDSQPPPEKKTPVADPFTAILHLNRQSNLLLERHLAPRDVYMEVTLAIGYAARLLSRYPEANRIPAEPPFEPDKQPGDVHLRLIECLRSVSRILDTLGLPAPQINTSRVEPSKLVPGDVFLVAATIVSQLDFLHKYLGIARTPPQPIYPGLRFPAHTYQRTGILGAQLTQLERFLATDRAAFGKIEHGANPSKR